ncbi:MAG: hypothetical protein WAT39_13995, partial [Planctomycetota bacterium]
GPYMRVWLLLWAFVPMERVPATLRSWCRERPLAGAVALLLLAGYGALVIAVAAPQVPLPLLLGGAGLLVWAMVRSARRSPIPAPAG